jgi:hypothetical protein
VHKHYGAVWRINTVDVAAVCRAWCEERGPSQKRAQDFVLTIVMATCAPQIYGFVALTFARLWL